MDKFKLDSGKAVVSKYLDKEIKLKQLLPILKWVGIGAGAFIADAAILGALSDSIVISISNAAAAFKGLPPSDLVGPGWFLTHPFKVSWIFLCHIFGAPINVTSVFNTWVGLNIIGGLGIAGGIAYKKCARGESDNAQERDIRKIKFVKVNYELEKEIQETPSEQVFLGLDDKRQPILVPWQEMTEHTHIMGGSGSGKTSFSVIPICVQAIRIGLPVVVIDFKGDKQAIQILSREAQKNGKRFYLFSLHPQIKSSSYNPIHSGNALAKVDRVLIGLDLVFDGPAKFYTYSQKAMFLTLLRYFEHQDTTCTLKDIHDVLKSPELIEEITGEKVNLGNLKGLVAALDMYCDFSQINTHEPDIKLDEVMAAGDVVYFDLRSSVGRELSSTLGKMIAMDLEVHSAFRTEHDVITVIAIDEFQNMAGESFTNIISKVRTANYAFVLANQAPSDLRAVSDNFLGTVSANTKTKIVFNIDNPRDLEDYAERSGNILINVESESQSKSYPTGQVFGGHRSKGKSVQEQEKNMINANQLLLMPFGKSAIYRRGKLAVFTNHAHLVTKDEKDRLINEPYPEPVHVLKHGVRTAAQEIERMKMIIIERKKQESQDQNQAQGRPQQQPGQGENVVVESEDFDM